MAVGEIAELLLELFGRLDSMRYAHHLSTKIEPAGDHIQHDDLGPGQLGEFERRQPNWPCPDDEARFVRSQARTIDGVAANGQGLDQGELLEAELPRNVQLAGLCVALLTCIGFIFIYSSSSAYALERYNDGLVLCKKTATWSHLGTSWGNSIIGSTLRFFKKNITLSLSLHVGSNRRDTVALYRRFDTRVSPLACAWWIFISAQRIFKNIFYRLLRLLFGKKTVFVTCH